MKYTKIKRLIVPHKKINIFVVCVLILGVIAGAIFSSILGLNDKKIVVEKITLFIDNINHNTLNSILVFKNSLGINLLYIFIIWILGMTLLGIIVNTGILFFKGFIFGFSIASFIITYSYRGIPLSILYLLLGQLINIMVLILITIYSIMFSLKLFKVVFKLDNIDTRKFFKNYLIIFILVILISIFSALIEAFILPPLIKLIIKLYV
jgi:stage II sporulation protein M